MAKAKEKTPYEIALERIAEAKLGRRPELSLRELKLTEVPPEIGSLVELRELDLAGNRLEVLPNEISSLVDLRLLDLSNNLLTTLPCEIGALIKLHVLSVNENRLLRLPSEIASLVELRELFLGGNFLSTLPRAIASLTELHVINVEDNQFTALPLTLASLPKLTRLQVMGNPLSPEILQLAEDSGGSKLLAFYRDAANTTRLGTEAPVRFDEAKVLFLGSGEVGKTWLLQALQGKVPQKTDSTKGIEIARQPLNLPHPSDPRRTLHLCCWDFGGQDHFQITHQIFFSPRAIYLLIWKPRPGVDPDLIDRLERIRLSAGRTARVLIVSTHANGSVPPVIGQAALKEQFGDLIGGFYAVDSATGPNGTGIAELKTALGKAVAQLEGLDLEYPPAWRTAREAVLNIGSPTVPFRDFAELCTVNGLRGDVCRDFGIARQSGLLCRCGERRGHFRRRQPRRA